MVGGKITFNDDFNSTLNARWTGANWNSNRSAFTPWNSGGGKLAYATLVGSGLAPPVFATITASVDYTLQVDVAHNGQTFGYPILYLNYLDASNYFYLYREDGNPGWVLGAVVATVDQHTNDPQGGARGSDGTVSISVNQATGVLTATFGTGFSVTGTYTHTLSGGGYPYAGTQCGFSSLIGKDGMTFDNAITT